MIQYDELPFLTEDKTPEEISLLYEDLCDKRTIFRESCKNFIGNFVPDWATEDERFDCDLFTELDNYVGEPWIRNNITQMWRDENRNLAFDNDGEEMDIDFFQDAELLQIVEQLSKS